MSRLRAFAVSISNGRGRLRIETLSRSSIDALIQSLERRKSNEGACLVISVMALRLDSPGGKSNRHAAHQGAGLG